MAIELKILFVEDSPIDAELAQLALSKEGIKFQSRIVENETDFIFELDNYDPDIIISDFKMPRFDGLKALKIASEKSPRIPFVLLTGSMDEQIAVECMKTGAMDYLIKEHLTRLPYAVKEALRKKETIAEKEKAVLELKESEERFHRLAENAPDVIYRMSLPDGKFEYISPAVLSIFGYLPEEFYADPMLFRQTIHPDWRKYFEAEWVNLLNGEMPPTYEYQIIHKNGEVRWLNQRNILVRDDAGTPIAIEGIVTEITERKQAELIIQQQNNQLHQLIAAKDKFFSIIAHDLRSPFSGFLNLTDVMVQGSEDFSKDELKEFSTALHESASLVYKLLENLLDWALIQKGSISYTPGELFLFDIVSSSINTIDQKAKQKGIIILNEIFKTQRVFADEKMINTVLRNLLSNAVKFTRREGRIIVRSRKIENDTVEVSVEDTGVGMFEKDVKRLFKMEEKVSAKGTEGELSTGLGLLLCKEFVEKHGGKIRVESERGKGTTFYFTIRETFLGEGK